MKSMNLYSKQGRLLLISFVLLTALVVSFVAIQGKGSIADLRSRAWSGVTSQVEVIRSIALKRGLTVPNEIKTLSIDDPNSQQALFHSLTHTYYNAEVQNISIPEVSVKGVAFLAYDPRINKTFIFSRIENLPVLPDAIVRTWLFKDSENYLPVGIGEWTLEEKTPVVYTVFTLNGDARTYKELRISYDSDLNSPRPESVVLTLLF